MHKLITNDAFKKHDPHNYQVQLHQHLPCVLASIEMMIFFSVEPKNT